MEWRCEWCGKPHEEDEPPCDNCGHGTFEKAVVQQPADGPAGGTTTVWVCTECGREHPKHAPPCSRCGNAELERREVGVDDSELVAPGYRDLLTPRYVLGFAVAALFGVVLLLGVTGVVDLPGMADSDVPTVEDVPGSADSYEGVSLDAVETAYLADVQAQLDRTDGPALERDERLDAVATFYNQRWVTSGSDDATVPSDERVVSLLEGRCDGQIVRIPGTLAAPTSVDSAESLGQDLADVQFARGEVELPPDATVTGVDVHAADGRLFVTQFVC